MDSASVHGDAFGMVLLETLAGNDGTHVIERDDGRVEDLDARSYFAPPTDWATLDRKALESLDGRTLDVGAGAGRFSLAVQERGHDVVALDVSSGALDVCRARGVREVYLGTVHDLAIEEVPPFDHVIMMGNNLGLLGSRSGASLMLDSLRGLVAPHGTVIGTCRDPYRTDDPDHLAYHQRNREHGRFPGQLRLRERYRDVVGSWFDYLFVSPAELADLVAENGWGVIDVVEDGPTYLATLRPL